MVYKFMALIFASLVIGEKFEVHRNPKYMVFPPGLGDKLQIIAGFGVPIDIPRQSLTYGLILKTNYALPNNATYFTNPYVSFAKRGVGASRWHLYKVVEAVLERFFYKCDLNSYK
uniref:Uncharacterized protein n=1 Tax=Clastoptera arizonana TaxID=38151 RepID=A0A1B6C161_9HEMI